MKNNWRLDKNRIPRYLSRFMSQVNEEIKKQGYSKSSFAKKIGVHRDVFENCNPSSRMIQKICDGLGYSPILDLGYKDQ